MPLQTSNDLRIVFVTVDNLDFGRTLAKNLVQKKLAACVTIVPKIESIYEWDDKVQQDFEVLLIVKTIALKLSALEKEIKSQHNYKIPEIIAVTITESSQEYSNWIFESCRR